MAHAAPVGVASADRVEQVGGGRFGRSVADGDGGEMGSVRGVGQVFDVSVMPLMGQRDQEVVQRDTATDHRIAAAGIGGGQLSVEIGEQIDRVAPQLPPPGLGVVHRGRAECAFQSSCQPNGLDHHGNLLGSEGVTRTGSDPCRIIGRTTPAPVAERWNRPPKRWRRQARRHRSA